MIWRAAGAAGTVVEAADTAAEVGTAAEVDTVAEDKETQLESRTIAEARRSLEAAIGRAGCCRTFQREGKAMHIAGKEGCSWSAAAESCLQSST
ncbi:hypothetical protein BCR35DRAFT_310916 [Leucosporidium creatinivorum]|uniref:Uncharacterized protein n=1 Tax=Leucosporidium creatinivorum TaxID=106004 RepID=A0A1Y2CKN9_9BASI|nr:hypothetical protein BCR35DRAFT_310916 [Leucosporidium creatinivorum]